MARSAGENGPRRKFVLVPIGLPGAGKTALVEWLASRLDCRVVSRDRIRSAMFVPCRFTPEEKEAAFRALQSALEVNLGLGATTLVDGMCFSEEGVLERVEAIARASGGIPIAVYCECPIEVAQQRVERDREVGDHPALDRNAGLVREVARRFRALPRGIFRVDMTQDLERIGEAVLRYIEGRLDGEGQCHRD